MKLDLACNVRKKEGFTGIDILDLKHFYPKEQFIQHDLRKGIPLENNSIEEIYTSNFLEHLTKDKIKFLMEEMYRVLQKDGKIKIICPHAFGHAAFRFYHKSYFTCAGMTEFAHPEKSMNWYKKPLFKITKKKIMFKKRKAYFWNYFIEPLINLSPYIQHLYEDTCLHSIFPPSGIEFNMVKEGRL